VEGVHDLSDARLHTVVSPIFKIRHQIIASVWNLVYKLTSLRLTVRVASGHKKLFFNMSRSSIV